MTPKERQTQSEIEREISQLEYNKEIFAYRNRNHYHEVKRNNKSIKECENNIRDLKTKLNSIELPPLTKTDQRSIESCQYIIEQYKNNNPNYCNEPGFDAEYRIREREKDIERIYERARKLQNVEGNTLAEKFRSMYGNKTLMQVNDEINPLPIVKSWEIGGWESSRQSIDIYVFEDGSGYYWCNLQSKYLTVFNNVNEIHEKIFDVVKNKIK